MERFIYIEILEGDGSSYVFSGWSFEEPFVLLSEKPDDAEVYFFNDNDRMIMVAEDYEALTELGYNASITSSSRYVGE